MGSALRGLTCPVIKSTPKLLAIALSLVVMPVFACLCYGQETAESEQQNPKQKNLAATICISPNSDKYPTSQPNSTNLIEVKNLGEVSVGCPKIWTSDRIFSVIDGIVRDVDSMTVRALQGVDPNQVNRAVLETLTTQFNVQGQFDQVQALKNKATLQNFDTQHAAQVADFKTSEKTRQDLLAEEANITHKLAAARAQEDKQIQDGANPDPQPSNDPTKWSAKDKALQQTKLLETTYTQQLSDIDKRVTQVQSQMSDLSGLSNVSNTGAPPATTGGPITLPESLVKSFQDQMGKGTFPATVQMDNVIDLLHERIAREFAAMYDDLMRESESHDIYLTQFDVSLLPTSAAKDRNVRVVFNFPPSKDSDRCNFLAYDLYPNAAAYNIMRGFQKTTHVGLTGVAQTVFGFGLQAAYQRDHSTLQSGLSQSLYSTSFGAGLPTFGWEFAPNPDDRIVAPGPRVVFAILLVDKGAGGCAGKLASGNLHVEFIPRNQDWLHSPAHGDETTYLFEFPKRPANVEVAHVSYVPHLSDNFPFDENENPDQAGTPPDSTKPGGDEAATQGQQEQPTCADCVAVQIRLYDKVDPNLIVTANDKLLYRVRDERGRGLYVQQTNGQSPTEALAGSPTEQDVLKQSRFGLLERDTIVPDSWYLTDSQTLILNLSKATAGTDRFPIIRFANPSSNGGELGEISNEAYDIRVGEWQFAQPGGLPASAFLPLFSEKYGRGQIRAYVENVTPGPHPYPSKIRIVSHSSRNGQPAWLHEEAQVVLEAEIKEHTERYVCAAQPPKECDGKKQSVVHLQPRWALDCEQDAGELVCQMPLGWMQFVRFAPDDRKNASTMETVLKQAKKYKNGEGLSDFFDDLKIWIDQPPFRKRLGIWADDDIRPQCGGDFEVDWIPARYYRVGDFELTDQWKAELEIRNINPNHHFGISGCEKTDKNGQRFCTVTTSGTFDPKTKICVGRCKLTIAGTFQNLVTLSPNGLTLVDFDLQRSKCETERYRELEIPSPHRDLQPRNLRVFQTGDLAFVQGSHLGGVVEVYLSKGGEALPTISQRELTRSARQLSFAPRPKVPGTSLSGTYSISLGIQGANAPVPVPAMDKDGKPLSLTFGSAEKPEKPTKPAPSGPSLKISKIDPKSPAVGETVSITVTASTGKPDSPFTDTVKFTVDDKDVKIDDHTFKADEKGTFTAPKTQFKTEGNKTVVVTSGKLSDKKSFTVKKAAATTSPEKPKPDAAATSPGKDTTSSATGADQAKKPKKP